MTIEEDIAEFLFESGLLGGSLFGPSTKGLTDGPVALVSKAWHAWFLRTREIPAVGAVSIGRQHSFYWPDALLGFLGRRGEWIWPTSEPGVILGPRAIHRAVAPDVGWPVWFTCARYEDHLTMQPKGETDVFEAWRRRQLRSFWEASLGEFSAKTWHPSRLAWCLDCEEIFLLDTS